MEEREDGGGSVRRRPTVAVLNGDLEKGRFNSNEERSLIEATIEGKNRDIVAIVKDEQLRRIWLSWFYQRAMMTKAAINKVDLEEVLNRIDGIKAKISMQHKATLLSGLGEILIK